MEIVCVLLFVLLLLLIAYHFYLMQQCHYYETKFLRKKLLLVAKMQKIELLEELIQALMDSVELNNTDRQNITKPRKDKNISIFTKRRLIIKFLRNKKISLAK